MRGLWREGTIAALGLATLGLAACGDRGASSGATGGATAAVPARFADYDAGSVAGGPGRQARFALGRPADTAEVARWNRDVGPDGAELPPGEGSVAEGAALYAKHCESCHNVKGEGKPPLYPALIGRDSTAEGFHFASNPKLVKTIGNYWPHATTLFDYVRRAMPLAAPGSLTDNEVYALTAFLLSANTIIAPNAVLDAESLRAVKMPYADRFVPDNRRGGPEVK